jgi:hypothetical protein
MKLDILSIAMDFRRKINKIIYPVYDILYATFSKDAAKIVISYLPYTQIDNTHRQEIINLILCEFDSMQLKQLKILLKLDFGYSVFSFIPTNLLISRACYVIEKLSHAYVIYKSMLPPEIYISTWICNGSNGSKYRTANWIPCKKLVLDISATQELDKYDQIYTPLFNDIDCSSLLPVPGLKPIKGNQLKCTRTYSWHRHYDSYSRFIYDPREYHNGRIDDVDKPNIHIYCRYHINTKLMEARSGIYPRYFTRKVRTEYRW